MLGPLLKALGVNWHVNINQFLSNCYEKKAHTKGSVLGCLFLTSGKNINKTEEEKVQATLGECI